MSHRDARYRFQVISPQQDQLFDNIKDIFSEILKDNILQGYLGGQL